MAAALHFDSLMDRRLGARRENATKPPCRRSAGVVITVAAVESVEDRLRWQASDKASRRGFAEDEVRSRGDPASEKVVRQLFYPCRVSRDSSYIPAVDSDCRNAPCRELFRVLHYLMWDRSICWTSLVDEGWRRWVEDGPRRAARRACDELRMNCGGVEVNGVGMAVIAWLVRCKPLLAQACFLLVLLCRPSALARGTGTRVGTVAKINEQLRPGGKVKG
jgi:hypothetical protein